MKFINKLRSKIVLFCEKRIKSYEEENKRNYTSEELSDYFESEEYLDYLASVVAKKLIEIEKKK